jgi:predicted peroxiredoxin
VKLAAIVAYAKDNLDKTTIGLTLVNAALDAGHKVRLILASEGVRLTVKGYADDMDNGAPFKPVKDLLAAILQKGGEINVCTPCMKKRGLEEGQMISGVRFIAGPDVIAILHDCEKTLQL